MPPPKVAIVIQGRIGSTRLPEKLFAEIGGKTALEQLYRRCRAAKVKGAELHVMVAVPTSDSFAVFERTGIMAVGGPEKDLVTRILGAARQVEADSIVRVTADNVLTCPRMIEATILSHFNERKPVTVNWKNRRFPNGCDLEVYDTLFLENIPIDDEGDREWFASWCVKHLPSEAINSIANTDDLSMVRLTVDYPEDLELARTIYKAMGNEVWEMALILGFLERRPQLLNLNKKYSGETGGRPK